MQYRRIISIVAISSVALLPVGCRRFASKVGVTWVPFTSVSGEEAIDPEVTKVHVSIRVGEIRVIGDSPDGVRVSAEVKIKESLANPAADPGTFEDHVRITTSDKTLTVADAHTGQPDEKNWRVSLVVHVPKGLAVNLSTGAGKIVVTDMTSHIKVHSGAGEVVITSTTPGDITVDNGAGKIEIAVEGVRGAVTATAAAGTVRLNVTKTPPVKGVVLTAAVGDVLLTIPAGSPGTFNLSADVGKVSVTGHDGITVQRATVGATGKGTIGTGGPSYKLEAGVGTVRVR